MVKLFLQFVIILVFFSFPVQASLGITPARLEVNFEPNTQKSFVYTVFAENSENVIEIYTEGDMKDSVTLSTDKLIGGGSFTATLKMGATAAKPGENVIQIRAREAPNEEGVIGTQVNIGAIIKVFVPYPGKYVTPVLEIGNGNVNSEIPYKIEITNRGKESLIIKPQVDFYTDFGENVYSSSLAEFELNSTEKKSVSYRLNTQGYKAGNYQGVLKVNYNGELAETITTFRIGSLYVNITNYTNSVLAGGIRKFHLGVENLWNDEQENVFAEVNVSNQDSSIVFRTPSTSVKPWESKTLEGFLDTTSMRGEYDLYMVLFYSGSVSTLKGSLMVRKDLTWIYAIIGVVMLIIVAYLVYRRKKWRNKK